MGGSDGRASSPIFEARVDERNGVTLLALCGELDLAAAPELENTIAHLNGSSHKAALIDLRDLSFIDSSGVRALVFALGNLRSSAGRVNVVAASDSVKRVFELLGLDGILNGSTPMTLLQQFVKGPTHE